MTDEYYPELVLQITQLKAQKASRQQVNTLGALGEDDNSEVTILIHRSPTERETIPNGLVESSPIIEVLLDSSGVESHQSDSIADQADFVSLEIS
ncbi:hypothetical protein K3495_g3284 [Podosphaera aphanis]|nr:hypothetical protein K3495_g3284 [Podosphaera aphanis]